MGLTTFDTALCVSVPYIYSDPYKGLNNQCCTECLCKVLYILLNPHLSTGGTFSRTFSFCPVLRNTLLDKFRDWQLKLVLSRHCSAIHWICNFLPEALL